MANSFSSLTSFTVQDRPFRYHSLQALYSRFPKSKSLPISLRILLENLLRTEDGLNVTAKDIEALANIDLKAIGQTEIAFTPARVLMQDFTGVPAVVDLAAMRDAMAKFGGDPQKINPLCPAELVIDHSVQVDNFGSELSFKSNTDLEYERNRERYIFLRWGQTAFADFAVVPPETGIVHQVNLEYLARVVFTRATGSGEAPMAYPDTVVGTDSHTTMINGLGVLGWGVGGIEAEAAMLGQPVSMLIPEVIGFRLEGKLPEGATATDLVLTVTEILRKRGVVGKFVEFYGAGLTQISLADRATIANMAPEYGATCGIFPVDAETIRFLRFSNRPEWLVALVEEYYKAQGLFHDANSPELRFTDTMQLDLGTVVPCLAGPSRPQDRVPLTEVGASFAKALPGLMARAKNKAGETPTIAATGIATLENTSHTLTHGSVVIAAITSCTNTSNPSVMLAAGLVAKKARSLGLSSKPWVKPSLAPGSKVVTDYLEKAGLTGPLNELKFNLVGYGCTTCIGNSGPLPAPVSKGIEEGGLVVAAVLSGNRNFEGRVHAEVRANYLASPPLVVAYALAGRIDIDFAKDPIGTGTNGQPVFLKDIWPSRAEVALAESSSLDREMFAKQYGAVYDGDEAWRGLPIPMGDRYTWDEASTYVKYPPYFEGMTKEVPVVKEITGARVLAVLGDSITTDHISPAGNIKASSPAGKYLLEKGVQPGDFNSYGARRGNHEVMVRGTFANIRLKNLLVPGTEGGVTRYLPTNSPMSIFDASALYAKANIPLIILAGKEYGSGSSRDWAAKGPKLLGVRAVIAESYERIHRSNLVGMGILPLQFQDGQTAQSLGLTGEETFEIDDLAKTLNEPLKSGTKMTVRAASGASVKSFQALLRIDTPQEVHYYKNDGILPYVLRQLVG
ncbi:MAG: aconitate hydratase AcnA [Planctomycetota bacterium]|nr:aconitate hydratase AcnA [Planctomycetota bacterium]